MTTDYQLDEYSYTYSFISPNALFEELSFVKQLLRDHKFLQTGSGVKNGQPFNTSVETMRNHCRRMRDQINGNKVLKTSYENFIQAKKMRNRLDHPENQIALNKPWGTLNRIQQVRTYRYYQQLRSHGIYHYHPRTGELLDEYLYKLMKTDHRYNRDLEALSAASNYLESTGAFKTIVIRI